jgi:hypothetical protein
MTTKVTKADRVDSRIDEIAQRILLELESASSTDLSDVNYAKKILHLADINYAKRMLQQIGSVAKHSSGDESEIEKRAVIKVLLFSPWLHRLYFIIRSFIYGVDRGGRYIPFHIFGWHTNNSNLIGVLRTGFESDWKKAED